MMPRDYLRRAVPDWAAEFLRFGVVGAVGFVVNVSTVYAVRAVMGLYAGGLFAWLVAATVTWMLNRHWTFRSRAGSGPLHRQWAWFLAANLVGFLLYYGTFVSLVAYGGFFAAAPIFAIFAGMLAGMSANFMLSRSLVFQGAPDA